MKTFLTFTSGYQEFDTIKKARSAGVLRPDSIDIVQIDESKLPRSVEVEDCIFACEDRAITRFDIYI